MERLRHAWAAVIITASIGCSSPGDPATGVADTAVKHAPATETHAVTLVHVNDTHSHLAAIGPKDDALAGTRGGLEKAASVIRAVRASAPASLFLHAGDVFEGDLYFDFDAGSTELTTLRALLGLDVLTLGNHEFNYGPTLLAGKLAAAGANPAAGGGDGFDVLSANVQLSTDAPSGLGDWLKKHTVRDVGGAKIGVFGLTTPVDLLEHPAPDALLPPIDPLSPPSAEEVVGALAAIAAQEVAALRAEGADVVVCLSHLGSDVDRALAQLLPASGGPLLPQELGGIDVIIGGHDEVELRMLKFTPGETIVVQAGHFYLDVGRLDLEVRAGVGRGAIVSARHQLIAIDKQTPRDPDVAALVAGFQRGIADGLAGSLGLDVFTTPIAFAPRDLDNEPNPHTARRDTGVGDLAADALQRELRADLGFTTLGFLNEQISRGTIVADDLFRALPYGINPALFGAPDAGTVPDPVARYRFTAPQLWAAIEFAISVGEIPQPSSNVRILYDSAAPDAVLRSVTVDGVPVDPAGDATFTVATNVFVAGAVSGVLEQLGLGAVEQLEPASRTQFDVLVQFVAEERPVITTPPQARVLDLAFSEEAAAP